MNWISCLASVAIAFPVFAGQPDKPGEENTKEQKASDKETYQIEAAPFIVETELSGVIESTTTVPIAVDLKRWSELRIESVVPHGTQVEKGDVLIAFDTDNLKKKIRDLKLELPEKEASLRTLEMELSKLEGTTPILKEKARKAKEEAEEDLMYFNEVSRPMRERDVAEDIKSTKNFLAYAEEELAQLKKMYERDDLTEETEEIILQRQQNTVENYRWMLEQTTERGRRTLETSIPREHEKLTTAVELRELEWKTDEKNFDEALEKKRLEIDKKRREMKEAKLSLKEHEADLPALKVTSPIDGIVYYGMAQRGKWTTAPTLERKLIPGQAATMREVMMTIVDPANVQIRAVVKGGQLRDLTPGKAGTATLKWNPEAELKVDVERVSYVPFADHTFDAVLSITDLDKEIPLMPGMQAVATIQSYSKDDAIAVPLEAVKQEDGVETVTLKGGEKREVETGRKNQKKVEIEKGLTAGDEIELGDAKPVAANSDKPEKK